MKDYKQRTASTVFILPAVVLAKRRLRVKHIRPSTMGQILWSWRGFYSTEFLFINMNIYYICGGKTGKLTIQLLFTFPRVYSVCLILCVCLRLFTGLTLLILEDVWAFFLHFCRGIFFFCEHASSH